MTQINIPWQSAVLKERKKQRRQENKNNSNKKGFSSNAFLMEEVCMAD